MSVIRFLKNRNFIFILAFASGFAVGNIAPWLKHLVVPALAVVLIVSLSQVPNRSFLPVKSLFRPALFAFLFNYVLFSLISLTLSYFLIKDIEIWKGFVILAAAPAGVAVAPFTGILGGDQKFSLTGVVASHLLALILIPLYGYFFIGYSFVQPLRIFILFSELIIVPFILSRIIIRFGWDRWILKARGPVVNWGLFVVIFVVIALNRDFFFTDIRTVGIVSLISGLSIFGSGLMLELVFKKTGVNKKLQSSFLLFATIKNGGFAAAASISLTSELASLPSAIFSVFIIIYLIYLSFRSRTFK